MGAKMPAAYWRAYRQRKRDLLHSAPYVAKNRARKRRYRAILRAKGVVESRPSRALPPIPLAWSEEEFADLRRMALFIKGLVTTPETPFLQDYYDLIAEGALARFEGRDPLDAMRAAKRSEATWQFRHSGGAGLVAELEGGLYWRDPYRYDTRAA